MIDKNSDIRNMLNFLTEAEKKVQRIKPKYNPKDIDNVINAESWELHFNQLYKGYVDKYNKGDHSKYNHGGYVLHEAFFEQLCKSGSSTLSGSAKTLIEKKFGTFEKFKTEIKDQATAFHGSGWIYLSTSGTIKTIKNHEPRTDVAVILDLWEHAFVDTFRKKKDKYIVNMWKIIDWDVVSSRIDNK